MQFDPIISSTINKIEMTLLKVIIYREWQESKTALIESDLLS